MSGTSPVSGGTQPPPIQKPQLVRYLEQRGLTQDEAQRVADTVDSGSSPVQFKDGQIVTDGSGVNVSLSDDVLSKEELAAMGFTAENNTDEVLIHGWAEKDKDGYQADGSAGADSLEAEDLGQMFADVQAYAEAYGITFDQALTIYLSESTNISRQNVAEIKANREARSDEHQESINDLPEGQSYIDWAKGTKGIPEDDPILQNLTAYLAEHSDATAEQVADQILLYAFASKFPPEIQTEVLGLPVPITRVYSGNYEADSLNAWYKNEPPAAPAAAVASESASDAAPTTSEEEVDPELMVHDIGQEDITFSVADNGEVVELADGTMVFGGPAATSGLTPPANPQAFSGSLTAMHTILDKKSNLVFRVEANGENWDITIQNGELVADNGNGSSISGDEEIRNLLNTAFNGREGQTYQILNRVDGMIGSSANSGVWPTSSTYVLNISDMVEHYIAHDFQFLVIYDSNRLPDPYLHNEPADEPLQTLADASYFDPEQGINGASGMAAVVDSPLPGAGNTDAEAALGAVGATTAPTQAAHIEPVIVGQLSYLATAGGVVGSPGTEMCVIMYDTSSHDHTLQELADQYSIAKWYEIINDQGNVVGWLPVRDADMVTLTGGAVTLAVAMPDPGATPEEAIALAEQDADSSGISFEEAIEIDASQAEDAGTDMTFSLAEMARGAVEGAEAALQNGNIEEALTLYEEAFSYIEGRETEEEAALYSQIEGKLSELRAQLDPPPATVAAVAGPAAESGITEVENLLASAKAHLANNEIEEAIADYQQAMALQETGQYGAMTTINLRDLRNLIVDKLVNDAQAIASDPAKANEAIALYQQAHDLLPEGHPRRETILTAIASVQPAATQPTVAAGPASPAAPTEPYNFDDSAIGDQLIADYFAEHSHQPIMSTIIRDRQPVAPAATEPQVEVAQAEEEPLPTPTPVVVNHEVNGAPGGVAPVPVQEEAPPVIVAAPQPSPAPETQETAPIEEPAEPPPPADALIVDSHYLAAAQEILDAINQGGEINQNAFYSSVISSNLAQIRNEDYFTVQQFVDKMRTKLLAAIGNIAVAESSGSPINGFASLIRDALVTLGQAMQTQDTREDDLAAYDALVALNESYTYYSDKCADAEAKARANDLQGAIAIYAELAARPDCPDFIAARHTELIAEAGAAVQAAADAVAALAEAKTKANEQCEELLAFVAEHPEMVGQGAEAALQSIRTEVDNATTLSAVNIIRKRLKLASDYIQARQEISGSSSTSAAAAQGEAAGIILASNMITSDYAILDLDIPTTGNNNQKQARWNLIVARILQRVGPFQGRIQLQINPTTGQLRLLLHSNDGSEAVKTALIIPDPNFHPGGAYYKPVDGQPGWFNVEYVDNNPISQ